MIIWLALKYLLHWNKNILTWCVFHLFQNCFYPVIWYLKYSLFEIIEYIYKLIILILCNPFTISHFTLRKLHGQLLQLHLWSMVREKKCCCFLLHKVALFYITYNHIHLLMSDYSDTLAWFSLKKLIEHFLCMLLVYCC